MGINISIRNVDEAASQKMRELAVKRRVTIGQFISEVVMAEAEREEKKAQRQIQKKSTGR